MGGQFAAASEKPVLPSLQSGDWAWAPFWAGLSGSLAVVVDWRAPLTVLHYQKHQMGPCPGDGCFYAICSSLRSPLARSSASWGQLCSQKDGPPHRRCHCCPHSGCSLQCPPMPAFASSVDASLQPFPAMAADAPSDFPQVHPGWEGNPGCGPRGCQLRLLKCRLWTLEES